MKILLLDNYDSFTYNLLHVVKELGYTDIEVFRNDRINLDEVNRFDKIILSPGPGIPAEAGLLLPIIKQYAPTKSTGKDILFQDLEHEIPVGRYHSWVVSRNHFPDSLEITAESKEGQIMALRHCTYDVHGIQFHPESVLTPQGKIIIHNFLKA